MASVTAVLPLHNEFQNNRLRWQDFANGLIDVSALRADAGTAWIVRFQPSGNGGDINNNIQIRTVETPDGGGGTSSGPQLSDAAEQYVSFATISVPGMTDLVLAGPNHPNVADQDTNEPYQWIPGGTYDNGAVTYNLLADPQPAAGLAGWVGDFKTTYAADNSVRATLTIDDGETPAVTPEALAGLVTAGEPVVSGNLRAIAPVTPEALAGLVTAGEPSVSGNLRAIAASATPPEQVMMVTAEDEQPASVLLRWDVPNSQELITRYDYSLDGGAWTDTTTTANVFLLAGLDAGTTYSVRVRAASANGNGPASVARSFSTVSEQAPGLSRFVTATAPGGRHVDLSWLAPGQANDDTITHYQVCVLSEDGTAAPFEDTDDASPTWRVRGLAHWHRYGFRVRGVNAAGAGPQTPVVYAMVMPVMPRIVAPPTGQRIPLLDEDRQSIIVTLGEQDCRISVWWQPSDESWYGSLEVPTNTMIVSGRRLALGSGLLDRIGGILPGNVVLRELGDTGAEPARDAWRRPTHALIWETAR